MADFSTLTLNVSIETQVGEDMMEQTLASKSIGVAMGYEITRAIGTLDVVDADELLKKINSIVDQAAAQIHDVLNEINEEVLSAEEARAAGL